MNGFDPPDRPPLPDEEDDLGPPIAELARLSEEPSARFPQRVRGGVSRKVLGTQFIDYCWCTPALVVLEYLMVVLGLFGIGKDEPRGEK